MGRDLRVNLDYQVMSSIQPLLDALPQTEGLLPKWQIIVATMAIFNTIQNFATLKLTRRLYAGVPSSSVTGLQARTFAAWTLTAAVVRGYAAYNIHTKAIYDMALFTYLIAFAHFTSELFVFRTARFNLPVLSPVIVSTVSLVWMLQQYEFYVKV